jgi:glycosyltransferase involved in cell wall biosynthesis
MHVTTFSVVIETENLAMGGVADLERCLDSLDKQTLDIRKANEVWIMVGGHLDPADAEHIRKKYPWTTIHQSNSELSYVGAKKLGAEISTGSVVFFADSDLAYDPRWLELIMTERANHSPKDVVCSDSRLKLESSYEFAMQAVWMVSVKRSGGPVKEVDGFHMNNFSIDRQTMIESHYDEGLPLYRGSFGYWRKRMRLHGIKFHRVPKTMGYHLSPQGVREWFYRMLIFGGDYVATANFRQQSDGNLVQRDNPLRRVWFAAKWIAYRWVTALGRTVRMLGEDWKQIRFVPIAIPIALVSLVLITAGSVITIFHSRFIFDRVVAFENSD